MDYLCKLIESNTNTHIVNRSVCHWITVKFVECIRCVSIWKPPNKTNTNANKEWRIDRIFCCCCFLPLFFDFFSLFRLFCAHSIRQLCRSAFSMLPSSLAVSSHMVVFSTVFLPTLQCSFSSLDISHKRPTTLLNVNMGLSMLYTIQKYPQLFRSILLISSLASSLTSFRMIFYFVDKWKTHTLEMMETDTKCLRNRYARCFWLQRRIIMVSVSTIWQRVHFMNMFNDEIVSAFEYGTIQ